MRPAVSLCLFLLLCLTPACRSPNKRLLTALDNSWALLAPYCRIGIATDITLDPEEREIRLRHVEQFTATLKAGLEAADGDATIDPLPALLPPQKPAQDPPNTTGASTTSCAGIAFARKGVTRG